MKRNALEAINGLRFFAIIHLITFHFLAHHRAVFKNEGYWAELPSFLLQVITSGATATGLFFILSGFILTYVYASPDLKQIKGSKSEFFRNRIARIWPLHITIMTGLLIFQGPNAVAGMKQWLINATLLQTFIPTSVDSWNTPAWAASAMMLFYVLFPILLRFFAKRSQRSLVLVSLSLIACNWLLCTGFYHTFEGLSADNRRLFIASFYYSPVIWLTYFSLGIITGLRLLRSKQEEKITRWSGLRADLMLLAMLTSFLFIGAVPHVYMRHALFMAFQVVLIGALAHEKGALAWLCRRSWVQKLAHASFTMYLLHAPLFTLWTKALRPEGHMPLWGIIGYYGVLFTIAPWLENHFVPRGRRLINQLLTPRKPQISPLTGEETVSQASFPSDTSLKSGA
ncbi:acyltransferase family protein [Pseudobacteriovorax antillogorgiicola]|uniref:Peptidoglycan/LPS O-acetylase OafA/YrhL, contains acyltransferase and SGNH-hydrolase domains n=1 Tax=Pseudobacteriovorax antillogorgiicola TaxID=1513793 RepID=A0A1Y6CQQ1_9BACT|nr:acyltransferase [Pseudobacteriovorax antillogorgiicola]TCS42872.1 peptidoglycan/LPS O-acetylase OafA/YrhL [Pseudobacteriovorax antillogorgiicola]SMF82067.1 Peptidoglycan/LPS O-acetylase OafA/YrhL, contains acyltransferase and SGNH-hydrolase domains [Pseudobacteriovorax antillogorgiicola]